MSASQHGTGRFDPDNARLRELLAWHASVTTELQGRIVQAKRYLRQYGADPQLSAILGGDQRGQALWAEVDTGVLRDVSD